MNYLSVNTQSRYRNSSKILTTITGVLLPPRTIIMWYGISVEIPKGWNLCDGGIYNGYETPDLRGRFVIAAGQGSGLTERKLGATGGEETHTLTISEMPNHDHTGTTVTSGDHSHTGNTSTSGLHSHTSNAVGGQGNVGLALADGSNTVIDTDSSSGELNVWTTPQSLTINSNGDHNHTLTTNTTGSHTHTFTTDTNGGGNAHNNMPPFYALYYIMKCF